MAASLQMTFPWVHHFSSKVQDLLKARNTRFYRCSIGHWLQEVLRAHWGTLVLLASFCHLVEHQVLENDWAIVAEIHLKSKIFKK